MANARILLTPKWLLGHLLALTLIALFVSLGFWQLRRLDERGASNQVIETRMEQPLTDIGDLLDVDEPVDYRRVEALGRFDPANEVLLRSRSRDGQPGWHVLTPLVLEDASGLVESDLVEGAPPRQEAALLVDRGWVPYAMDQPPIAEAAPPEGQVRVTGILRSQQQPQPGPLAFLAPRDPEEGRLRAAYYADAARLQLQMPYRLLPLYLELSSQQPERPGELPLPPDPPSLERGSHLSYALQWFTFAAIGIIGYSLLLWRTVRSP